MGNILIIGGTKFIGSMLVDKFLTNGCNVTVFSRSAPKQKNIHYIQGDRNVPADLERLKDAVQEKMYDRIYDMCCYEPDQAERIAPIILAHTKKLIFFSSAAVYAKTEFFPLRENSLLGTHPSFGDYGTNKAAIEEFYRVACKEYGIQLTGFRPHYILGIGDYFKRHEYFYSRIEQGRKLMVPGNGEALVQFAYAPDVVDLFYTVPGKQVTQLECLNIASNELMTLKGVLELFAASLQQRSNIVSLDYESKGLHEDYFYDDLFPFPNLNLILDCTRAQTIYGFAGTPLKDYIDKLASDWNTNKQNYTIALSSYEE